MSAKRLLAIILLGLWTALACDIFATPVPSRPEITAAALTLTALAPSLTPPPIIPTNPLIATALPPTLTLAQPGEGASPSPTSSAVILTVSLATNCRSGPGKDYPQLGSLQVGETAQAVGRYTPADYWVIQNPDAPGTCWLWGQYVSVVSGDPQSLPQFTPPPSPTMETPTTAQAIAGIFGYVYHDDNRNGRMDGGEAPYPGFSIYLSLQELGPTIQESLTDATGLYSFSVTPGRYWLSYSGGPPVCPAHAVKVTVNAGDKVRQDFGVLPCSPMDASCRCP